MWSTPWGALGWWRPATCRGRLSRPPRRRRTRWVARLALSVGARVTWPRGSRVTLRRTRRRGPGSVRAGADAVLWIRRRLGCPRRAVPRARNVIVEVPVIIGIELQRPFSGHAIHHGLCGLHTQSELVGDRLCGKATLAPCIHHVQDSLFELSWVHQVPKKGTVSRERRWFSAGRLRDASCERNGWAGFGGESLRLCEGRRRSDLLLDGARGHGPGPATRAGLLSSLRPSPGADSSRGVRGEEGRVCSGSSPWRVW